MRAPVVGAAVVVVVAVAWGAAGCGGGSSVALPSAAPSPSPARPMTAPAATSPDRAATTETTPAPTPTSGTIPTLPSRPGASRGRPARSGGDTPTSGSGTVAKGVVSGNLTPAPAPSTGAPTLPPTTDGITVAVETSIPGAAYPCSSTPGGEVVDPVDTPAAHRTYAVGHDELEGIERAAAALTTASLDPPTGCECGTAQPWQTGMQPAAVAGLVDAMERKYAVLREAAASSGGDPDSVPVERATIWLRSAARTSAQQECLLEKYGPGTAAAPGRSPHQLGVAIDVEDWGVPGAEIDLAALRAAGWCRTVRSEPWHYEFPGAFAAVGRTARCLD